MLFLAAHAAQRLYHGTKADLKPGDLISAGYGRRTPVTAPTHLDVLTVPVRRDAADSPRPRSNYPPEQLKAMHDHLARL
ncbi:MAG TPA: hypothetical protein VII75_01355, partial [Thermoanaerobaculia bacterium]